LIELMLEPRLGDVTCKLALPLPANRTGAVSPARGLLPL